MSAPKPKLIHLPKVRMLGRPGRPAKNSIRITNIKTIKPPDPATTKKQEEDQLRAQLQEEIMSRSKSCANNTYSCSLPVLTGRQYCGKHILQDATAPYKQCVHTYSNGVRCPLPAPVDASKDRDQGLCFEHARAALYARQRSAAPAPPQVTPETLLYQLQHYILPERTRTTSCASSVSVVSEPSEQEITPNAVDPFKQIDAQSALTQYSTAVQECASASESDADSVTMDLNEPDWDVSNVETVPKWGAGVFTAEEAVSEAKEALISLRSAYTNQMVRLKTLLQMSRLQYLRALKTEKEQYCSINSQSKNGPLTVRERRQLRKLKAYASYHKPHGVSAILARKLHKKRIKAGESHSRGPPPVGRCSYTEGGVRCTVGVLPASKRCLKHILYDENQVLFSACGDNRGGVSCQQPIAKLPLPSAACRYHTDPPVYTVFTLKKEDTDSDSDSSISEVSQTEEFADQTPLQLDSEPFNHEDISTEPFQ